MECGQQGQGHARAVILATRLDLQLSEAVCDFVQDVCEADFVAAVVRKSIDDYCPQDLRSQAHSLLAQIRQGTLGGRPKTEYFFHCWGVFEGGGVRAAAHAGAFTAARRAGVSFGRVAGTSGGSIVAALIAAGATPAFLRRHLEDLDFKKLLDAPAKGAVFFKKKPTMLARGLSALLPRKWSNAVQIGIYGGLHESKRLGEWIEQRLVELLRPNDGTHQTPVLFEELKLPLYVVATDFSTGQPKVWSREETGGERVALAVLHSCTIPFFFQPAGASASLYFDGGAVSNLPAYVMNTAKAADERDVLPRILAFRLMEDDTRTRPVEDIVDFAKRLSAAVIDSASEIQLRLQPNVYQVEVKTGDIQSTDFDKITIESKRFLYGRGVQGVRAFFNKERLMRLSADVTSQEFRGFDEKMLLFVRQTRVCKQSFLSIGRDTYWLDHGFPSLLLMARRGVSVKAIVAPLKDIADRFRTQEARRRQLLTLMGANVSEVSPTLPFSGFAFDLGTSGASAILSYLPDGGRTNSRYDDERVRLYTADSHQVVLNMVSDLLQLHAASTAPAMLELGYEACTETKLVDRMRGVPMYRHASIRIERISVSSDILVMQKRVKEFKALQIRSLMSDLAKHGQEFFGLIQVRLANISSSILTPPVLERHAGSLVVIEGNTRLHHCLANGIDEVDVVVVDELTDGLPSDGRHSLADMRMVSSTFSMLQNYQNLRESEIRRIEHAVHIDYN